MGSVAVSAQGAPSPALCCRPRQAAWASHSIPGGSSLGGKAAPPGFQVPLQLSQLRSAVRNGCNQLPASRGSVVARPVHLQCIPPNGQHFMASTALRSAKQGWQTASAGVHATLVSTSLSKHDHILARALGEDMYRMGNEGAV